MLPPRASIDPKTDADVKEQQILRRQPGGAGAGVRGAGADCLGRDPGAGPGAGAWPGAGTAPGAGAPPAGGAIPGPIGGGGCCSVGDGVVGCAGIRSTPLPLTISTASTMNPASAITASAASAYQSALVALPTCGDVVVAIEHHPSRCRV